MQPSYKVEDWIDTCYWFPRVDTEGNLLSRTALLIDILINGMRGKSRGNGTAYHTRLDRYHDSRVYTST